MIKAMVRNQIKKVSLIPYRYLNGYAFPPRIVNFTATLRCNLNCRMCLQRDHFRTHGGMGQEELSGEEIKAIVRQTLPKVTWIGFCGGEIFLRQDMMDILKFTTKRNPVRFVTNATMITEDIAEEIVRMGVREILISLDGTREYHDNIRQVQGTFDKTLAAIECFMKYKRDLRSPHPEIDINTVVMEENLTSLPELLEIVSGFGIKQMGIQMKDECLHRFSPMDNLKQAFATPSDIEFKAMKDISLRLDQLCQLGIERGVEILLKPQTTFDKFADYYANKLNMDGFYCTFPWETIILSPYGEAFPCYMLSMGNVRKDGLLKVWNSKKYRDFRNILKKKTLFPQCRGCCFLKEG